MSTRPIVRRRPMGYNYELRKLGSRWLGYDAEDGKECVSSSTSYKTVMDAVLALIPAEGVGQIYSRDPGSTVSISDTIQISGKRVFINGGLTTFQPASGKFCFEFVDSHTWSTGHPMGGIYSFEVNGNSRAGSGIKINNQQQCIVDLFKMSACDEAIRITAETSNRFSEGTSIASTAGTVTSSNVAVNFVGAGGSGSFMDTSIGALRCDMSVQDSSMLSFDPTGGTVKPHNSHFFGRGAHAWIKAQDCHVVYVPDSATTTQFWGVKFGPIAVELYTTGGVTQEGAYFFGTSLDLTRGILWEPLPLFLATAPNGVADQWDGVNRKRIPNPEGHCLGQGHCITSHGAVDGSGGAFNWEPDGSDMRRIYVSNGAVVSQSSILTSYN